jgi:hypothetical protein
MAEELLRHGVLTVTAKLAVSTCSLSPTAPPAHFALAALTLRVTADLIGEMRQASSYQKFHLCLTWSFYVLHILNLR